MGRAAALGYRGRLRARARGVGGATVAYGYMCHLWCIPPHAAVPVPVLAAAEVRRNDATPLERLSEIVHRAMPQVSPWFDDILDVDSFALQVVHLCALRRCCIVALLPQR